MKSINRFSILLLIMVLPSSCFMNKHSAVQNLVVTPLSDSVIVRDGSIVYGLPRTVLTVFVEMERTIEKPGTYANYAADLLGMNEVIKSESELWSIMGIRVDANEELDPSEYYVIKSNTLFQSNVLSLKKEGLILDLNPLPFNSNVNRDEYKRPENNQFRSYDFGSDEYYFPQRDTVFRRVKIDSSFIRIPYIVDKKKMLTKDQLAEKAAKRLMELRDGKHLILTGEATVFPQSDAPVNEMNRMEKEYTELFSGKTIKESRTFTYQIIPEKEMSGNPVTLFHFSPQSGPLADNIKGGMPFNITLVPEQKTKDLTFINKPTSEPDPSVFDKLYYRVPDVVNLKINMGNETLLNSRKLIYQFGEVIQLPANYIIGR